MFPKSTFSVILTINRGFREVEALISKSKVSNKHNLLLALFLCPIVILVFVSTSCAPSSPQPVSPPLVPKTSEPSSSPPAGKTKVLLQDSFRLTAGNESEAPEGYMDTLYGSGSMGYGWYCSRLFFLRTGETIEITVRCEEVRKGEFCAAPYLLRGESLSVAAQVEDLDWYKFQELDDSYEMIFAYAVDASGLYCLCLHNDTGMTGWVDYVVMFKEGISSGVPASPAPLPINHPPYIPSNPSPLNHATDVSTFTLSWSGGDPDPEDVVTYDVYFGTSLPPPLLVSHQFGTTASQPFPMPPPGAKCYWKIIATDNHGSSTEGPLWDFNTATAPPPSPFLVANTPIGPSIGKVNQLLTFSTSASSNIAGSPEYRFGWGDGSYSDWSSSPSASHSWSSPGRYTIRAQARYPGTTSEWSPAKVVEIEQEALSRQPFGQPEQMKQYITPNDPKVKAAVNDILSGEWRWAYNDFNALREWVCWHVSYHYDQDVHGVSEYWQFPAETLELGTGDCEDFAILLCTLLRAYGVPADEVYVIGGYSPEGEYGHAFLYEHWYKGIWRAIEPQYDPLIDVLTFEIIGPANLGTYTKEVWCFNDKHCIQGMPSLPAGVYEFEVDYSFWPATRGASVMFERHLNTGQEISGTVEWPRDRAWAQESYQIVYDWSLYVYAPDGSIAFSWSGTDLKHDFSFKPTVSGTYKLEILKRDYLARCARLTINPTDWVKQ
jgi:predicted transglutaminase-like cysteine proteinase